MALQPAHGNRRGCADCHEEQQDAQDEGPHASVSCAECHAPLSVHAKANEKTADMPSDASYRTCAHCHFKLRARPKAIKQIVTRDLLEPLGVLEPGEPIPERGCIVCHDAHTTKEKE